MIVIGYQGIGKSTTAKKSKDFIDLESGSFWVDGKRSEDWYKAYCQVAEHLSAQDYFVFVSSHEAVRNALENSKEVVIAVYPNVDLKDAWIERLQKRYEESALEKDYKALINAKECFEENIKSIENCAAADFLIVLENMDYDLEEILSGGKSIFESAAKAMREIMREKMSEG